MISHTSTKRTGFTLVELLVVIGIIAIMIAILLPALKKVKDSANSIKCMASMRQIMTATMMYTNENRGALPLAPSIGDTWRGGLTGENASLAYYMSNTAPAGAGVLRFDAGSFMKYLMPGFVPADAAVAEPSTAVSQPKVLRNIFNCPSDDAETFRPVYWGAMRVDAGMVRNFSYSWNRHIRVPYGPHKNAVKLSQVKSPAHKILLLEEMAPNDGMCWILVWGGYDADDEPSFRHNGKGNYGFADGHVQTMPPSEQGFKTVNKNGYDHSSLVSRKRAEYWYVLTADTP